MHYLDATPRSRIRPFCRFLGGTHSSRGSAGLKMLSDGRTAGHWPLSGPQGAAATLSSHRCQTADCNSHPLQLEPSQPCVVTGW